MDTRAEAADCGSLTVDLYDINWIAKELELLFKSLHCNADVLEGTIPEPPKFDG